jgi:S-DNA-T family DNA segregation ATPase FtsK/SpoIIIE
MERRMEVLRASGNFKNREDYEEARQNGADLPPMPSLFLVVDEFSELLTARPEFIDLFLQIGRIGRSVAVHLLLASQRLEENKLRGLDTYLSYRIALRTFSPAESRTVIGVPDAYELPTPPGNGYLKFDTVSMVRFKAAYVSGPWEPSSGSPRGESRRAGSSGADPLGQSGWIPPVLEFTSGEVAVVEPPQPEEELPASLDELIATPEPVPAPAASDDAEDEPETLLSIVVNRLHGHGWPAHQVWLPPLDAPPSMDKLLPALRPVEGRGLTTADPRFHGTLHAPVALVDRPRQQRRDPMWLDLSGAGGNMAIAGGPQSGKSTAVRATIAGLALTHTPREVGFYCLDFGGGSLTSMRDLVHIGSVCGRLDVDRVRRTVAEMTSLMQSREILFAELGIDGIGTYRRGRRDGTIEADRFPTDVFLVVDGWMTLRQEFEEQENPIATIAARGLGYGLHIVATANKWSELRPNIRDMMQSRVELKLGDHFESEVNRKVQQVVPRDRPGRGISNDSLHMLVALPRIDGSDNPEDVTEGQRRMIGAINGAWQGPRAAEVRMLPDNLPYAALPRIEYDGHSRTIPIGIDEAELAPVWFDPAGEPLLAIFGAPECGKSSLLRVLLNGITSRYTAKEAKIAILDYRHSLLGVVEGDHLLRYAGSSAAGNQLINDVSLVLKSRLPGPEVTQQQLRDKSWWKGAEVFVVVNDYELASTSMNHALAPLADFVSLASDIGLHIILARGMGGAGRAVFSDAIVSRMKDAQAPALIMSGTRDEGALFGDVKPSPLPVGRGTFVTRLGKGLIQTANLPGQD